MGLSITAYGGLTPADTAAREERDDLLLVYANPHFPGREAPLESGLYYISLDCFDVFDGGYGRWGLWREHLAVLAGYPRGRTDVYTQRTPHSCGCSEQGHGPFFELIHFSDCEGVIGPHAAAKLLQDFEAHQAQADQQNPEFLRVYNSVRDGLRMAARGGCLHFH